MITIVKELLKIMTMSGRAPHRAASILKISPNNIILSKRRQKPQEMTTRATQLLFYPTPKESLARVSSWTVSTKKEAVIFMMWKDIHLLHKCQHQMLLMKMRLRKNIEISYLRETLSSSQRRRFSTSIE